MDFIYCLLTVILLIDFVKGQSLQLKEHIEPCLKSENLNDELTISLNTFKHGIIQSPNYPKPYPKDENCIFSLKAPKNYVIVLKSLEKFSLEPSDGCLNDYLEIRDGKYGYSPLIGKYCDANVPKLPIQSSGQHMWIKFDSDESIQSDGFKIIYEFRMVGSVASDIGIHMTNKMRCEMEILPRFFVENSYGILTNSDMESLYYTTMSSQDQSLSSPSSSSLGPYKKSISDAIDNEIDCTVHIEVPSSKKILVWIDQINITLVSNHSKVNWDILSKRQNCAKNFLEFYDGSTSLLHQRHHFCSSETNKFFKSQTNKVFFRYNLEEKSGEANTVYFRLTFNPFETGKCKNATFQCSDNTCINSTLVCNGVKNCKYVDDESNCRELILTKARAHESKWTYEEKVVLIHKVIISTLGLTLAIFIVISINVSCKHSIKKDQVRRKEFQIMNDYLPIKRTNEVNDLID